MNISLGTKNYSIILPQPIHAKIISMPRESLMMRFNKKSTLLIAILIVGHISLAFISPLGELTIMVLHDGDGKIKLCNKLGCNEGMRCSGIKENCCRARDCEEHIQYHILGLLRFLSSHMVELSIGEVLLPLQTLRWVSTLGLVPIGTVLSHIA
jgi:hypothetical protein